VGTPITFFESSSSLLLFLHALNERAFGQPFGLGSFR
jgi:hypothetical protein